MFIRSEIVIGKTEKLILEALEEPLTIEEVSKKIYIHRITASKYLAVLEARGLVKYRFICKAKLFSRVRKR